MGCVPTYESYPTRSCVPAVWSRTSTAGVRVNPLQCGTDQRTRSKASVTRKGALLNHAVFRGGKSAIFHPWSRGFSTQAID